MHGLIWGVVRFEGAESAVEDLRRISHALSSLAQILDPVEFVSENAFINHRNSFYENNLYGYLGNSTHL